ncbi:hypothetical protein DN752_24075 [Echinicola strongylocentroti]|uniref:Glycosyl hydrolase 94 catalytic domain-containing protein n=1 Tax=Echinicola strongylocentroti TaxID=1795355 RepID=A0A2Z4IPA7_9BACT|nr:amylo-alpha-1,6-glucosidase [Echinicola strongylocentroti]AWW32952.1 hypothetical protein DN752_24075 [Echinicola strongylocentroti]
MKNYLALTLLLLLALTVHGQISEENNDKLSNNIVSNEKFEKVKKMALKVVSEGFNAGDGYREVWIRDYNTFINIATKVYPKETLRENLLVFFRMQADDGNIIDGFTPVASIGEDDTDFSYSELEPRYAGHKNTVETDQETSLVQTVYKYIKATGDFSLLSEKVGDKTVAERLEWSMDYLMEHRFDREHGLLWGATTADWGDVQPEHGWGVDIDKNTHRAIDIYDNAMMVIALANLMEIMPESREKWATIKLQLEKNIRKHLWDAEAQKFIPHIYLEGSPFPEDFKENEIFYFGGTAIAIEAGLLTHEEIEHSLNQMVSLVKQAGAPSIGLTVYPPYPAGYFANKIMNPEYSYQNGGDWTWFGGRMVLELVKNGFVEEAYREIQPMVDRVIENDGFYEWYSVDNQPRGSGTFRGSAGVLYDAIVALQESNNTKN